MMPTRSAAPAGGVADLWGWFGGAASCEPDPSEGEAAAGGPDVTAGAAPAESPGEGEL
jgi:hypothetical protein